MELTSFAGLGSTREKLRRLEQAFEEQDRAPARNDFVKSLSRRSLKRSIQQLKEEMARFRSASGEAEHRPTFEDGRMLGSFDGKSMKSREMIEVHGAEH